MIITAGGSAGLEANKRARHFVYNRAYQQPFAEDYFGPVRCLQR
jgi:hypothetical protein